MNLPFILLKSIVFDKIPITRGLSLGGFASETDENNMEEERKEKTVVDLLHEKYLMSSQYQTTMQEIKRLEKPQGSLRQQTKRINQVTYSNSFFTQLYWVSQRSLKNLIRNPQASVAQVRVRTAC